MTHLTIRCTLAVLAVLVLYRPVPAQDTNTKDPPPPVVTEQAQEMDPAQSTPPTEQTEKKSVFGAIVGGFMKALGAPDEPSDDESLDDLFAEPSDEPMMSDDESVEDILRRQRDEFNQMIQDDPAWKPSHEETAVIKPLEGSGADALHSFCLNKDGNLLIACGGNRYTYEMKPDSPFGYELKAADEPAEIRVLDGEGKLLESWKIDFIPQTINLAPDGTIFVGGEGRLAQLDATGKVLKSGNAPNFVEPAPAAENAGGQATEEKDEFDQQLEQIRGQRDQFIQGMVDQGMEKAEAEKQADQIISQYEQSLKEQREQQIKAIMEKNACDREAAVEFVKQHARMMRKAEAAMAKQYEAMVNGIAADDQNVFVVCSSTEGYGFSVWRMDRNFENPKEIVTGLRGCCGQMDIQTHDGKLYVAENAQHRVLRYDAEGNLEMKFGQSNRKAPEGFGGCCEPKNLRFGADGSLFACESGPPVIIRRFNTAGEFQNVVGFPTFTTGCVRVTVEAAPDQETFYVLNANENCIHVLKRIPPQPQDAEAPAAETPAASE